MLYSSMWLAAPLSSNTVRAISSRGKMVVEEVTAPLFQCYCSKGMNTRRRWQVDWT